MSENKKERLRQEEYNKNVFGHENPGDKELIKAALAKAHEIRQFEINLYWKRSLFFWGFILTFFSGFIFLRKIEYPDCGDLITMVGLSYLGLFTSIAWRHLERGAHSWQENWEQHIDFLEYELASNLHKTIIGKKIDFYSINKILQSFIIVVTLVWLGVTLITVQEFVNAFNNNQKIVMLGWGWYWGGAFLIIAIIYFFLTTEHFNCLGYWRTSNKSMPSKGQSLSELAYYKRELPIIKSPSDKSLEDK